MELGLRDDEFSGVKASPPVPETGLVEVLSRWMGRGSIWQALSAVASEGEAQWSEGDLRARSYRILMERITPVVRRWPQRLQTWLDLLPAERTSERTVRPQPFAGVSWVRTREEFGWPPERFVGKQVQRSADTVLVTALRWTLEGVMAAHKAAQRSFPEVAREAEAQLEAAGRLLQQPLLSGAPPIRPRRGELTAMRREGSPWGAIAEVAEELLQLETSAQYFASTLLMPDDGIRWRLFHLAVLGVLLRSLERSGCRITSVRPLGGGSTGPSYAVVDAMGAQWEVWFEAASIWTTRGVTAPYQEATKGLYGIERALGADILLIGAGEALAIECKYSWSREFVARNGYLQAVAYAAELKGRLADRVTSVAIGPEGVIQLANFTNLASGDVGLAPPSVIPSLVERVLGQGL